MDLVESAHREALKETQPVQRPPLRIPGYPEYTPPPSSANYRSTTFSHLFQDFSRCVRQAILLQARLDSGAYDQARPATPHTQRAATQAPPAEPRATNDTTGLEYERLEDDLAAEASRDPEDILAGIETTLDAGKNLLAPVTLPRQASAIARPKAPARTRAAKTRAGHAPAANTRLRRAYSAACRTPGNGAARSAWNACNPVCHRPSINA